MATRQELLLVKALRERGLTDTTYSVDHPNGRATLADGRVVGVVHPDSFFEHTAAFVSQPKTLKFHFAGNMRDGRGSGRRRMLGPFAERADSVVRHDTWCKLDQNKASWHQEYYAELASAEFGPCPHHMNWPHSWETLWTYRFIDCCLVGTIPVQFRATPLGADFVAGFHYVWDDDERYTFDPMKALENRTLAEERFRL